MKRSSKGILASLRLVNSFVLPRFSTTRSLHSKVTQYSHLSPCFSSSLQKQACKCNYDFLNTHQKLHFSSKPNSIFELVLTNEWSEGLELELEKSNTNLTHETVLYFLKKLENNPLKASNLFNWVCNKNGFKPNSTVYDLMLRILGSKEYIEDFWVVIKKMVSEGYDVDQQTYFTLLGTFRRERMDSDCAALTEFFDKTTQGSSTVATVRGVVEVIKGSDWNDEVMKTLGELKLSLSENIMVGVFRELRKYPLKALGFFRWVEEDLGFKHNAFTYNGIVRVLGQEESIGEFWSVVKEMKNAGYDLDSYSYVKLSRQFQKAKKIKDAVELYELMMDTPYKPSIQDCTVLLRHISLSSDPDLSLVFRVVRKYEAAGHTLSKGIYDGIHRSLTRLGKFDEAEKVLGTMRNAGYEPDNITYSQLVFGLCNAGKLEEACDMLDEMEERGCVPDLKTWTILIQGHCIAGEVDKAMKCFQKMLSKNFEADADLLNVLVNSLCKKNKVVSAYTMLVEGMNTANLRPSLASFRALIPKLLEEGKFKEALNLLRLMKEHKFPPFPEPFVDYVSKLGTVEDAREFLEALSGKESPTYSAYLHVFRSFFREGRHSEAQDLLHKSPHHIRSNVNIMNLFASSKEENPISSLTSMF